MVGKGPLIPFPELAERARGGLDVSGFRRIHWAKGPHSKLGEI